MRRPSAILVGLALAALAIHPALAEQPAPAPGGGHEHGQQQGQPAQGQHGQPAPGAGPGPGRGMMGGGMMMGGMHGGGAMGGMRARSGEGPLGLCPSAAMMAHHDGKAAARSLKLCGELVRAMGDVLVKHAAELEKAGP
jgi:hypothetical protein